MSRGIVVSIIVGIVLLAGLAVGLFLVQQQQEIRKKAAPATSLSLSPPSRTVEIGETVKLSVNIDTAENSVTAAQLFFSFDPQKLTLTELKPGPFLPIKLQEAKIDNIAGTASIYLSAQPTNPQQGQGLLATLTLRAKQAGSATVEFASGTKVAGVDETTDVVTSKNPATITILSAAGFPSSPSLSSPTPQPTPTTSPSPSPTPSPTPTPAGAAGGQLPQAGFSLPTTAAVLGGTIILLLGIILAF